MIPQSLTVFNQFTLLYIDTLFFYFAREQQNQLLPYHLHPDSQVASSFKFNPHPSTPVMASSPSIPVSHFMNSMRGEI